MMYCTYIMYVDSLSHANGKLLINYCPRTASTKICKIGESMEERVDCMNAYPHSNAPGFLPSGRIWHRIALMAPLISNYVKICTMYELSAHFCTVETVTQNHESRNASATTRRLLKK
jgi:hypothetical protein